MGYFKARGKKYRRKIRLIKTFLLIVLILIIYYYVRNNVFHEEIIASDFPPTTMASKSIEIKNDKPIVYIYNTHQSEEYSLEKANDYDIKPSVLFASYILKWYLEDLGINVVVEESNITEVLRNNNLKYKDSYKASRMLLETAFKENDSLKYFVDLHRDSSSYNKTTCNLEGINYAKIEFVVGLEHTNYEKNLQMATSLNDRIKKINPCFSRGIYQKQGKGVNGIYNQDFNENLVLIEVGGQYNTISEVNNILKIFAGVLYEYIGNKI